jgi:dipeptidyl aminopeptidase/acylaminoacyl peptidase
VRCAAVRCLGSLRRWPGAALVLALSSAPGRSWPRSMVGAQTAVASAQSAYLPTTGDDTSWIDIRPADGSTPLHPITLDEIVSLREVHEPHRSPGGRRVAFVVRQAFRPCNCYRAALYVVDTASGSVPTKLLEEGSIGEVRWTPDGRFISYLSTRSGPSEIWRVNPDGGAPEMVFEHRGSGSAWTWSNDPMHGTTAGGVLSYEWAGDGRRIAFTATKPVDTAAAHEQARAGWLYDDRVMIWFNLLVGQGDRYATQLWVYEVSDARERLLWQTAEVTDGIAINDIAWSPDAQSVAFTYLVPPGLVTSAVPNDKPNNLGIVEVDSGRFTALVADGTTAEIPTWSANGSQLAFATDDARGGSGIELIDVARGQRQHVAHLLAHSLANPPQSMSWAESGWALLAEQGGSGRQAHMIGMYSVPMRGGSPKRLTPDGERIGDCERFVHGSAACVREAPMIAPSPVLVTVAEGGASDSQAIVSHPLATINPELASIVLNPVTTLHWTNRYGTEATGYLIRPTGYRPGLRYPLVIFAYGFDGGFVTQASAYLTSYPAQVMAQDGFAVLLVNPPRINATWVGRDFARGSVTYGYGPLASLEAIVHRLGWEGLVDTTRVGMAGHSYGGFLTQFVLTHSKLLGAAADHNGGAYNPGGYWLFGNRNARVLIEHVLGGPPYGQTLARWMQFSPAFNAARVRVPVLMEYAGPQEAFKALEMEAALQRAGVPFDLFVYQDDGHVFYGPDHRFYSMMRHRDWFNFWLRGVEDPGAEKNDQYTRWRAMRDTLDTRPAHRRRSKAAGALSGSSP